MSKASCDINTIAVIGGGLIGVSWTALFAAHGLDVRAFDPSTSVRDQFEEDVQRRLDQLRDLGAIGEGRITLHSTVQDAAEKADFVQENAPERPELKTQLFKELEEAAPQHAIFASSTSSLTWSQFAGGMTRPGRAIVAHPFNPPHLLPLVEIYGEDDSVVDRAWSFYEKLDRTPIRIRREAAGHVANRLSSALFREAVHIVAEGIADAEDVDTALKAGPGLRWAALGVFLGYHLGGGEGGIRHYLEHLGPSQEARWASLGEPKLSPDVVEKLVEQILASVGTSSISQLAEERDGRLIDMIT